VQDKIRLGSALDGFGHLWVSGVDEVADLAADGLLPIRQGTDVRFNARVGGISHSELLPSQRGALSGWPAIISSGPLLAGDKDQAATVAAEFGKG
jgi:hypothetical protein